MIPRDMSWAYEIDSRKFAAILIDRFEKAGVPRPVLEQAAEDLEEAAEASITPEIEPGT